MAAEQIADEARDAEDGKKGGGESSKLSKLKYSSDILVESKQSSTPQGTTTARVGLHSSGRSRRFKDP